MRSVVFEAGMDDYISKPIQIEALMSALSQRPYISVPEQRQDLMPKTGSLVLETEKVQELMDRYGSGANRLIEVFLTTAPVQIEEMRKAIQENDLPAIDACFTCAQIQQCDFWCAPDDSALPAD